MADNNTVARPYAQAVFELARDTGNMGEWAEVLEVARAVLADGQAARFLARPSLTAEQRLEFLRDLFESAGGKASMLAGGSEQGLNFLKLLLEYDRVVVLPEIADHFDALKAATENTLDVTVTSAAPLDEKQRQAITAALKQRLGRDISLQTITDENLIGGAVIRAGDVVIDGSLRARLDGLANALIA